MYFHGLLEKLKRRLNRRLQKLAKWSDAPGEERLQSVRPSRAFVMRQQHFFSTNRYPVPIPGKPIVQPTPYQYGNQSQLQSSSVSNDKSSNFAASDSVEQSVMKDESMQLEQLDNEGDVMEDDENEFHGNGNQGGDDEAAITETFGASTGTVDGELNDSHTDDDDDDDDDVGYFNTIKIPFPASL